MRGDGLGGDNPREDGSREDVPREGGLRGTLITFEGDDGAGKTTHISFLAQALKLHGAEVVSLREPGGTVVGEALRDIVLDTVHENMTPEAELLIYEAARAQIVAEVIRPALERGAVVLCDRFLDSSVAYQAYGRNLDRAFVDEANDFAVQGIYPDRTFLMTRERRHRHGHETEGQTTSDAAADVVFHTTTKPDRLELAGSEFHDRVRAGFEQIAAQEPMRVVHIDANGAKSATAAAIFHALSDLFPWMGDDTVCDEAFFAQLDEEDAARSGDGAPVSEDAARSGDGAPVGDGSSVSAPDASEASSETGCAGMSDLSTSNKTDGDPCA